MITVAEFGNLVEGLDRLVDQVGEDESYPLTSMMDVLSAPIENHENATVPELALN